MNAHVESYLRYTKKYYFLTKKIKKRIVRFFKLVRAEEFIREIACQSSGIEAKPSYANVTSKKVIEFVWNEIIVRFGLPKILVSDNRTQFDSKELRNFCYDNPIEQRLTAVRAPWVNGQVERTNRTLLNGKKKG